MEHKKRHDQPCLVWASKPICRAERKLKSILLCNWLIIDYAINCQNKGILAEKWGRCCFRAGRRRLQCLYVHKYVYKVLIMRLATSNGTQALATSIYKHTRMNVYWNVLFFNYYLITFSQIFCLLTLLLLISTQRAAVFESTLKAKRWQFARNILGGCARKLRLKRVRSERFLIKISKQHEIFVSFS